MGVYNINKIESWYNEFSSLRNNYINNYYKNYNNSYIKRCNDSNVAKMRNKLNAHYEKIKKLYDGINKYWREYLNDVKNTDNRLAGKGGGINAASLASKLNSMPRLKEYNDGSYTIVMKTNNFFNKYSYDIESILDSFKNEVETGAIFTRTSATVTVFTASCAEGIIKLVEMAADGVVILGTIAITKYALYADVYNHIIGRESNYTKKLWDKTRAHVSKDYTKTAFDLFYDNTGAGRWLKNNAYGFDTVREIGCEVGEVVGVVALSAVTGGSAAVMYGAAKGVEHTEENWQDSETSTFAGLVKGGLQGAADGAFFALGAKGDQVMKNVAKNAVEQGGKTALKKAGILTGKMGFEVGCSLVQDCSNIFINAYFKEGNLGDNLKYYYDQAGGSKQLLISASTAMILSGISDAVDLGKIGKNVDANLKSVESNVSINRSQYEIEANKYYKQNYLNQGVSYEEFINSNGIFVKDFVDEKQLAMEFGDENWYLVDVLNKNKAYMDNNELLYAQKITSKPRLDLDTNSLYNASSKYLTPQDLKNLQQIRSNPYMKDLTLQQRNTLYQFQKAGGCDINRMCRGTDYSRLGIKSMYDLEIAMNDPNPNIGYRGANAGHTRVVDRNYSIIDEVDDIIKNNSNVNTIKGVSYLESVGDNVPTKEVMDTINAYGYNSPEALNKIQSLIGLDITDSAYNSKTIPPSRATGYSNRYYNKGIGEAGSLNIKVESYISPGCGAYIDTYGGIENGLGEMLIKRNCTQTIIDAYIDASTGKLVLVTLYT